MTVLQLFIQFVETTLNFKILDIPIINYLITFTILGFIFNLIGKIGNKKGD